MLNKEECQNIISRVLPIIDFEIDIINNQGLIIASTENEKINQDHLATLQYVKENGQIIIDNSNSQNFPNCIKGINIPIYNNEVIIGVICIIDNSVNAMNQGMIIKELIEYIITENETQQFKMIQQEAMRSFFVELLNTDIYTNYDILMNRAKLLEFDYEASRVLVLGQIVSWNGIDKNISHDMIKKRVQNTIRHHIDVDDISLMLNEDFFVLIIKWRANLEFYLDKMFNAIKERLLVNVNLVVGGSCDNISDYGKRYLAARRVSEFSCNTKLPNGVHFANKYELELLLGSLTEGSVSEYLENYENIIYSDHDNKSKNELLDTIKVYFESNMNIGETAKNLYVHRNTVGYRLNKFKEQFKVSINKPFDCMKIYIAIKILEQKKIDNRGDER